MRRLFNWVCAWMRARGWLKPLPPRRTFDWSAFNQSLKEHYDDKFIAELAEQPGSFAALKLAKPKRKADAA